MHKSFLSQQSEKPADWTLRRKINGEKMMQATLNSSFGKKNRTFRLRIDFERLSKISLVENIGASNVFKVLTANFMKNMVKKDF